MMNLIVLLLLLIPGPPLWAQRDVVPREGLIDVMRVLNRGASPGFIDSCAEDLGPTRIYSCGTRRPSIIRDVANASIQLNRMVGQVNAYYRNPLVQRSPARMTDLNNIKRVLICMQSALREDLSINCSRCFYDTGTRAFVNGIGPVVFHNISLCSTYFRRTPNSRSATLLHELSHMCGTEDYEYFFDSNGNNTAQPHEEQQVHLRLSLFGQDLMTIKSTKASAVYNADNYHYWSLYGFCFPNLDCGPAR